MPVGARTTTPRSATSPRSRRRDTPVALLERLEDRALLANSPLPALTDLTNQNDTVVRLQTNFGDIDIELFDTGANAAPLSAANFLRYVSDGRYDESFFHRSVSDFVVQGGGYRFNPATRAAPAIAKFNPVLNEFSATRSNLVRTIAYAKQGPPTGQPATPETINSATDEFFFNLGDNASNLDAQNGGFTVFARVVNDASWNVVLAISNLRIANLGSGAFGAVPVTATWNPQEDLSTEDLASIIDAEVIKPQGGFGFYSSKLFYAEGFAGSSINEFVPMENPGDNPITYQVVVRREAPGTPFSNAEYSDGNTWFRDRVISTGVIPAHSRAGITVSHFGANGAPSADDLVPQGVPYSIEVHTTGFAAATISHYDFGSATGETFTDTRSTTWAFGEGNKVTGSVFNFLLWENANDSTATLTVDYFFAGSGPITRTYTTGAFRRGGVSLGELPELPENTPFSIRITADKPIVAALTQFETRFGQTGSASLGITGDPSVYGVVPLGQTGVDNAQLLAILNPGSTGAVVTLHLVFSDPNLSQQVFTTVVPQGERRTFDFASVATAADRFSVYYTSGSSPVYVQTTHVQTFSTLSPPQTDSVSNPVGTVAANTWHYAEGFMDPARAGIDLFETISVFNPNSPAFGVAARDANITLRFRYTDGTVLNRSFTVPSTGRLDVDIHTLQGVLDLGANSQLYFYSIEVASDVPIVSQMWHWDLTLGARQPSGGFGTLGLAQGAVRRLDALAGPGPG